MLNAANVDRFAVDNPWLIFEFQRGLSGRSLEQIVRAFHDNHILYATGSRDGVLQEAIAVDAHI